MLKKVGLLFTLLILLTSCGNKELQCDEGMVAKDNKCVKYVESRERKVTYSCNKGNIDKDNNCLYIEEKEAKLENGCEDGYTLEDGKCLKNIETDTINIKYCVEGTSNGEKCIVKQVVGDVLVSHYCPVGYSYNKDIDKCIAKVESRSACKSMENHKGFKRLDEDSCYLEENNKVASILRSCSINTGGGFKEYKMDGDKCVSEIELELLEKVGCPDGYTLNGNKCIKKEVKEIIKKYTCDKGYTLKNKKCYKEVKDKAKEKAYCDDGYELIGDKCYRFKNKNT